MTIKLVSGSQLCVGGHIEYLRGEEEFAHVATRSMIQIMQHN